MLRFEQLSSVCVGQAVDEINRLGPVVTEDQSASLPASVRARYGRLTEVPKCVSIVMSNSCATPFFPLLCAFGQAEGATRTKDTAHVGF